MSPSEPGWKSLTCHQLPNSLTQGAEGRLGLPHFPGDIVSSAQLVTKALAFRVDHQATHAAQGLGRQELDLGLGVIGLHQASGGAEARPTPGNQALGRCLLLEGQTPRSESCGGDGGICFI